MPKRGSLAVWGSSGQMDYLSRSRSRRTGNSAPHWPGPWKSSSFRAQWLVRTLSAAAHGEAGRNAPSQPRAPGQRPCRGQRFHAISFPTEGAPPAHHGVTFGRSFAFPPFRHQRPPVGTCPTGPPQGVLVCAGHWSSLTGEKKQKQMSSWQRQKGLEAQEPPEPLD